MLYVQLKLWNYFRYDNRCHLTWDEVQYLKKKILTQIYEPIIFFQSRPGADPNFLKRGDK
jgi:hypothetical protein